MLEVIICGIFAVMLILLIVQGIILFKTIKKTSEKDNMPYDEFSDEVNYLGDKMMKNVTGGKIKKQLLMNDAPPYDSHKTMEKYKEFVDKSSLYQRIVNMGESRYYG